MSALARYYKSRGKQVSGYDKAETTLTKQLIAEGIPVYYHDDVELVAKNADIVVYTPAIPKDHKGLLFYQQQGYPLLKRSDALAMITKSSFNICVAGTHGKTTITSMIAHILRHSGYGCNAFLGGIASNYNSNFWSNENNVCVVEADEYDRSFLKLHPDVAVISAMDADHLDIYGTEDEMQQAFIDFSDKIKQGGILFSKWGLPKTTELKADHHFTYSRENKNADVYALNITMQEGGYIYDVNGKSGAVKHVELNMGGLHNVENSVAAIAVAEQLGIEDQKIKAAVASFKGVKRRFEYIVPPANKNTTVYVDDYAHHPAELESLITGAKLLFGDRKCVVIFQPHLFSRTRDFATEFAASLDLADEVILLPIYPARELPLPGVTSEMISDKMKNDRKMIMTKAEVLTWLKNVAGKKAQYLLITAGAGDIDQLVQPIKDLLLAKEKMN